MNRTVGVVACPACLHVVNRAGVVATSVARGWCLHCGNDRVPDDETCPDRVENCSYCHEGMVTIDRAVAYYFRK